MPIVEREPKQERVQPSLQQTEAKIKEIESWLDKLEQQVAAQQTTSTLGNNTLPADNNQSTITPPSPSKPIVLPLTKREIETGLHRPLTSAIRWLAEWSIRMIKMYHNRVRYPAPA